MRRSVTSTRSGCTANVRMSPFRIDPNNLERVDRSSFANLSSVRTNLVRILSLSSKERALLNGAGYGITEELKKRLEELVSDLVPLNPAQNADGESVFEKFGVGRHQATKGFLPAMVLARCSRNHLKRYEYEHSIFTARMIRAVQGMKFTSWASKCADYGWVGNMLSHHLVWAVKCREGEIYISRHSGRLVNLFCSLQMENGITTGERPPASQQERTDTVNRCMDAVPHFIASYKTDAFGGPFILPWINKTEQDAPVIGHLYRYVRIDVPNGLFPINRKNQLIILQKAAKKMFTTTDPEEQANLSCIAGFYGRKDETVKMKTSVRLLDELEGSPVTKWMLRFEMDPKDIKSGTAALQAALVFSTDRETVQETKVVKSYLDGFTGYEPSKAASKTYSTEDLFDKPGPVKEFMAELDREMTSNTQIVLRGDQKAAVYHHHQIHKGPSLGARLLVPFKVQVLGGEKIMKADMFKNRARKNDLVGADQTMSFDCSQLGSGKTIVSLASARLFMEEATNACQGPRYSVPLAVICPNHLVGQWKDEMQKMGFPETTIVDGAKAMKKARQDSDGIRAVIIANSTLSSDNAGIMEKYDWLVDRSPYIIILDEAHELKIKTCKYRTVEMAVRLAKRVFVLSGTPNATVSDRLAGIDGAGLGPVRSLLSREIFVRLDGRRFLGVKQAERECTPRWVTHMVRLSDDDRFLSARIVDLVDKISGAMATRSISAERYSVPIQRRCLSWCHGKMTGPHLIDYLKSVLQKIGNSNGPKIEFVEVHGRKVREGVTKEDECPICYTESVEVSTECGHWTCKECIKAWLSANPGCPSCRQNLKRGGGPVKLYPFPDQPPAKRARVEPEEPVFEYKDENNTVMNSRMFVAETVLGGILQKGENAIVYSCYDDVLERAAEQVVAKTGNEASVVRIYKSQKPKKTTLKAYIQECFQRFLKEKDTRVCLVNTRLRVNSGLNLHSKANHVVKLDFSAGKGAAEEGKQQSRRVGRTNQIRDPVVHELCIPRTVEASVLCGMTATRMSTFPISHFPRAYRMEHVQWKEHLESFIGKQEGTTLREDDQSDLKDPWVQKVGATGLCHMFSTWPNKSTSFLVDEDRGWVYRSEHGFERPWATTWAIKNGHSTATKGIATFNQ